MMRRYKRAAFAGGIRSHPAPPPRLPIDVTPPTVLVSTCKLDPVLKYISLIKDINLNPIPPLRNSFHMLPFYWLFMFMSLLPFYAVYHVHAWYLQKPEENTGASGTGVNRCELCECRELNPSLLYQSVLLTTKLSFQPSSIFITEILFQSLIF